MVKETPAATSQTASQEDASVEKAKTRRMMVGTVVSDKMDKTIVVKIDRRVRHPLYNKYVTRSRRFKAHDEKNEAHTGDLVQLVETRPLSKEKRFALRAIIRKGGQAPEANV